MRKTPQKGKYGRLEVIATIDYIRRDKKWKSSNSVIVKDMKL